MAEPLRIVHYLNQFFGGKGGEEKANLPIDVQEGAVGPGRALSQVLGQRATVVATIIGGDNFVTENTEQAIPAIRDVLADFRPHVVLAGPAFDAGRYGLACGIVCKAAQEMGIPAITAMTPDNPGVMEFRKDVLVMPTGDNPAEMQQILARIARIALKLASGEELGPAESEGYLSRGIRRPGLREKPASVRAVDMLVARMKGETFTTELPILLPERVPPALPIADIKSASLAMVTTGGLVPKGNPDRLVRGGAKEWFRYSLTGLHELGADDWECVHRGFFTNIVNQNPNYILPLNVMRDLEDRGIFASVYPWFFSTSGVGTAVGDSRRMGAEMGRKLKEANVEGCILVATWGTCNRCGATIAKEIERAGVPVAVISALFGLALTTGANRVIRGARIEHVCGNPGLGPEKDRAYSHRIVQTALQALQTAVTGPTLFDPETREVARAS